MFLQFQEHHFIFFHHMFLCFHDVQVLVPEVHILPCHVLVLLSAGCYSAVVCCLNSHNTDGAACLCTWRQRDLGGISPPLLLPPTSFFPLRQRLSLAVTLIVSSTCRLCLRRSAPLSVSALAPATGVCAVQMLLISPARKTARHPESVILLRHNLDPAL